MLYCDNPFRSACQYDSDCDSDTDITDNSFGSSYQFDSSKDKMENHNQKYPDEEDLHVTKQHGNVSTIGRNSLKTWSTKHDPKFVLHSVLYMFRSERFPFLVSFVTLPVSILKENRLMDPAWYHGVFYVPRYIPNINQNPDPAKQYLTFDPIIYGQQSMDMYVEWQKLLKTIIYFTTVWCMDNILKWDTDIYIGEDAYDIAWETVVYPVEQIHKFLICNNYPEIWNIR